MKVPLLDLAPQHAPLENELLNAITRVMHSGEFIMGPDVQALENAVAKYCDAPYAIGVSSGTDALLAALMALGVGAGNLVITTAFSFFATAGVIVRLGARPVFADIEPDTFNLDPQSLIDVWGRLTLDERKHVRAIMPVHLFGQCADMDPILRFAEEHNIPVIEDAAQAIGSEYLHANSNGTREIRKAGTMGVMGCFSFFPSKNLGGFGDGGMVITADAGVAERLRVLRVHGAKHKYYHDMVGGNFRLDTLQAAVLLVKLVNLDQWHRERRENAARYNDLFRQMNLEEFVALPYIAYSGDGLTFSHIYNQYVILAKQRDALRQHLTACGIGTAIYYPVPFHLQPCFANLGYRKGGFPQSELAAEEVLAIPVYPGMDRSQQEYVVQSIAQFYCKK